MSFRLPALKTKPNADIKQRIQYDIPLKRCPQCGKQFVLRCTVEEWGPVYGHIPLCSIGCMRAYELGRFLARVKRVRKDRSYTAYRMHIAGRTDAEIGEALGISMNSARTAYEKILDHYWKEAEYLDKEAANA